MSPDVIGMIIALFAFLLTGLAGVAGMLNRQTKTMDGKFVALGAAIDRRFELVDRRFDEADRRFDEVDRRFELIDRRFEDVDRRFEDVDRRFAEIDQRFERIDRRFEKFEEQLERMIERFVRVEGEQVEIKVAIARLEGPRPRLQQL